MDILKNHPAIAFGDWLKKARMKKGFVKRVFAEQMSLTPAQYTELEAGVAKWFGDVQRTLICPLLHLSDAEVADMDRLAQAAKSQFSLAFSNLFSREQLEPVRFRHGDDRHHCPSKLEKQMIVNAVLTDAA